VEFGGWVDGSNCECTNGSLLNLLKEVGLLGSKNSHSVDLIHKEDTICASTQHDSTYIAWAWTDNNKLVEDGEHRAVITGPTELTCVGLLGRFVVNDSLHVCLHYVDCASVFSVSVHGYKIFLGI